MVRFLIFWGLILTWQIQAEEEALPKLVSHESETSFPSEFTTKKGVDYLDCKIKRIESDAIIIEHREGVAKISFFEMSAEFQRKHGFDPVAAMEKYRRDLETQRETKWKRFWEAQKHEAAVAAKEDRKRFLEKVKANWNPIEASVLSQTSEGAYVRAKRIVFDPTKTKSTLGFEIDGPPRKTLVPLKPNVIFIEATGVTGQRWMGYLAPLAHGTIQNPTVGNDEIPRYRAVARNELE